MKEHSAYEAGVAESNKTDIAKKSERSHDPDADTTA